MTDRNVFDALYAAEHRRVRSLAVRLVGEPHADDVAQEAWLKVARGMGAFRGDAALSSWVYRIVWNVAMDTHRLAKRKAWGHQVEIDAAAWMPSRAPSPERQLMRGQAWRAFVRRCRRMSATQRRVMAYALAGEHIDTAARAMGIPTGTFKSTLHRAKRATRLC